MWIYTIEKTCKQSNLTQAWENTLIFMGFQNAIRVGAIQISEGTPFQMPGTKSQKGMLPDKWHCLLRGPRECTFCQLDGKKPWETDGVTNNQSLCHLGLSRSSSPPWIVPGETLTIIIAHEAEKFLSGLYRQALSNQERMQWILQMQLCKGLFGFLNPRASSLLNGQMQFHPWIKI